MITRLIPLFPFNLQNYAYGLTKIRFATYFFVSWICMLPGTAAYVQLGAAVNLGEGDIKKTLIYLAGAGIFIVLVSLISDLDSQATVGEDVSDVGLATTDSMIAQFVIREDESLDSGDMRGHGEQCEYTEEDHPL